MDTRQCITGSWPIGESPPYFRQYILYTFANWRISTVLSPNSLLTFAIGECPVGESHIGEIRKPRQNSLHRFETEVFFRTVSNE